jgi:hypothetical protein
MIRSLLCKWPMISSISISPTLTPTQHPPTSHYHHLLLQQQHTKLPRRPVTSSPKPLFSKSNGRIGPRLKTARYVGNSHRKFGSSISYCVRDLLSLCISTHPSSMTEPRSTRKRPILPLPHPSLRFLGDRKRKKKTT